MDSDQLAAMRQAYQAEGLDERDLVRDPYEQLDTWLKAAIDAELPEPNAMVLSTVANTTSGGGCPSTRTVLLKGVRGFELGGGLIFYTNHTSRKGQELAANPNACVLFPWHAIGRQVSVTGRVERLPGEESAAYFRSRPRGSQLGAWASHQSQPVASPAQLRARYRELAERWPEPTEIPVPDFWGGYRLEPTEFEFWQGRPDRLHDRLVYRRSREHSAAGWEITRRSP